MWYIGAFHTYGTPNLNIFCNHRITSLYPICKHINLCVVSIHIRKSDSKLSDHKVIFYEIFKRNAVKKEKKEIKKNNLNIKQFKKILLI